MQQMSNIIKNTDSANVSLSKKSDLIQGAYHKYSIDNSNIKPNMTKNRITLCFSCKEQMEIQEGTILFDTNWFHDSCWQKSDESEISEHGKTQQIFDLVDRSHNS